MKYFNGITDKEQAKLRYRKLSKQLHPDAGGTAVEFQKLQEEYKIVVECLRQNNSFVNWQPHQSKVNESPQTNSLKNDFFEALKQTAQELIQDEVPQNILKFKIEKSKSPQEKTLLTEIVNILDSFK